MSFEERIDRYFTQFRTDLTSALTQRQQRAPNFSSALIERVLENSDQVAALNQAEAELRSSYALAENRRLMGDYPGAAFYAAGLNKYLERYQNLLHAHINTLGHRSFNAERGVLWGAFTLGGAAALACGVGEAAIVAGAALTLAIPGYSIVNMIDNHLRAYDSFEDLAHPQRNIPLHTQLNHAQHALKEWMGNHEAGIPDQLFVELELAESTANIPDVEAEQIRGTWNTAIQRIRHLQYDPGESMEDQATRVMQALHAYAGLGKGDRDEAHMIEGIRERGLGFSCQGQMKEVVMGLLASGRIRPPYYVRVQVLPWHVQGVIYNENTDVVYNPLTGEMTQGIRGDLYYPQLALNGMISANGEIPIVAREELLYRPANVGTRLHALSSSPASRYGSPRHSMDLPEVEDGSLEPEMEAHTRLLPPRRSHQVFLNRDELEFGHTYGFGLDEIPPGDPLYRNTANVLALGLPYYSLHNGTFIFVFPTSLEVENIMASVESVHELSERLLNINRGALNRFLQTEEARKLEQVFMHPELWTFARRSDFEKSCQAMRFLSHMFSQLDQAARHLPELNSILTRVRDFCASLATHPEVIFRIIEEVPESLRFSCLNHLEEIFTIINDLYSPSNQNASLSLRWLFTELSRKSLVPNNSSAGTLPMAAQNFHFSRVQLAPSRTTRQARETAYYSTYISILQAVTVVDLPENILIPLLRRWTPEVSATYRRMISAGYIRGRGLYLLRRVQWLREHPRAIAFPDDMPSIPITLTADLAAIPRNHVPASSRN